MRREDIRKVAELSGVVPTPVEEKLPFEELHLAGKVFVGRTSAADTFAKIDELMGGAIGVADFGRMGLEEFEDGMRPHSPPPVFAVRGVGLPSMHEGMPVAAGGGVQVLADLVRFVEKVVQQPQARKTGGGYISTVRSRYESRDGKRLECGSRC